MPPDYPKKFADFIKLREQTKKDDVILIATPESLGDNYEELIESLNRVAESGGHLVIVPRSQRQAVFPAYRNN